MKLYLTILIHKHRFFLWRNISKSRQTFGHIPTRYQVCQRPSHLHIRSTDKYLDEIWQPFTLETQYKPFYKVPKDNLDKQNEAISMFALLNACKQFYLPFKQVERLKIFKCKLPFSHFFQKWTKNHLLSVHRVRKKRKFLILFVS